MSAEATLDEVVETVRTHPGLLGKGSIGLVRELLGPSDGISGPGDDAALVATGAGSVVVGGEALWPPFVEADPRGAGIAAVVANVNDLAAMGARPLGIVDTLVGSEPVARLALEGLARAAAIYRVPIIGGHLTLREGPPSLSAFGVGVSAKLLSAANAAPGQTLLVASCLEGRLRSEFTFFSSIAERAERLADDVRTLAEAAETGLCVAAKDVSMAGLLGSLAMLLEGSRAGVAIDLARVPRPPVASPARWAVTFPTFSFLLCAPPGRAAACQRLFQDRGLACEPLGELDATRRIRVRLEDQERQLFDLASEPITGLWQSPGPALPPGID